MPVYVIGAEQIIMNLNRARIVWLGKIADAVEKSVVDGSNHAKDEHSGMISFFSFHGGGKRYRNRTTDLTKSIEPKMFKISVNKVVGGITTNMEYAPCLEFGTSNMQAYPFLFPALVHIQPILRARLEMAIRGL